MPIVIDQPLVAILDAISADLVLTGMDRRRGGTARSVMWAEASGRLADASWGELRVHHRPTEHTIAAGMLVYQPLARGGRTMVVGEITRSYVWETNEIEADIADEIRAWLVRIRL